MTREDFHKYIAVRKALKDRFQKLQEAGLDLLNYDELFWDLESYWVKSVDTDGWISWFCYEAEFGESTAYTAVDKNGGQICRTVDELYDLVFSTTAS